MVIASFNRIDRLIDKDLQDPIAKSMFNQFKTRFKSPSVLYKKGLFSKEKFQPDLIPQALEKDELLNDLIFRADNLTYYIGHAFIGLNPAIKSTHGIPTNGFKNLNNSLLGQPSGNDLREHKTSGIFLCIGFIFSCINFKQELDTKEKIVTYYLDNNNVLNFDLKSFSEFIHHDLASEKPQSSNSSNSVDSFLQSIISKLKKELACDCFYEYKNVDEYKNDMALQLHLPLLLMEMGLKLEDVMGQNNFICTIAVEIDEYDNIVTKKTGVNLNDWDVENALEQMLNTAVTSVGAINKNGKKFRTLKFIIR